MKITAIKQQIKRPDRYSISVDGKYCCSFSESTLLNLGLRLNQEITPEQFNELKNSSTLDKAKTRAFDLIARRPRSSWELEDYLHRKGYEKSVIQQTLNTLSNLRYVDDSDFAKRWVANRRLLKSSSKRRLIQELRQKRIADDIIQETLRNDETDEKEVLRELVARKRKQSKYQDNLKLMQYLARQGYNYDDIKTILEEQD